MLGRLGLRVGGDRGHLFVFVCDLVPGSGYQLDSSLPHGFLEFHGLLALLGVLRDGLGIRKVSHVNPEQSGVARVVGGGVIVLLLVPIE
jgi:hypothetical protein